MKIADFDRCLVQIRSISGGFAGQFTAEGLVALGGVAIELAAKAAKTAGQTVLAGATAGAGFDVSGLQYVRIKAHPNNIAAVVIVDLFAGRS